MDSWPLTLFGMDDGLPSNQVHDIAQGACGRLWLAGPAGLTCHDGTTVRSLDRRDGLQCNGLRAVAVDPMGTVWIGTDQGLEALSADDTVEPWSQTLAWPFGLVDCMAASLERLWVGSRHGLVCVQRDAHGRPVIEARPEAGVVVALTARAQGHAAWAATAAGELLALAGGQPLPMSVRGAPSGQPITCLAHAPDNLLLAGTQGGLLVIDAHGDVVVALPTPSHAATAVAATENEWWVAYGNRIQVHSADPGTRRIADIRISSNVNALLVDQVGNVWVGTDSSGLQKVSCLRHAIASVPIGNHRAVYSIRARPDATLRVGGEGFCSAFDPADPGRVDEQAIASVPERTVWDSHEDASGVVWLATQDGVFRGSPGNEPARFGTDHVVLACPARVLLEHAGWLWIGTLRGLARVRDGSIEEIAAGDGSAFGYVYSLEVDSAGRLWIATLGRGLWRMDGTSISAIDCSPLTANGNTYAVAEGPQGQMLVLQDNNIVHFDSAGNARLLMQRFPVSGWSALWIEPGLVLLGSSHGLQLLRLGVQPTTREVSAMFAGGAWEFTNTRTLALGPDGRVYCGVNGGLFAVSLPGLQGFDAPPEVRAGAIDWRGTLPESRNGIFRLRPGKWSMRVHAFSAWFVDETHVTYRFRLTGFEDEWSTLQRIPDVSYSSLPPGKYALVGQAFAPLVGFGPVATLCRLRVAAPAWGLTWLTPLAKGWTLFASMLVWPMANLLSRKRHRLMEAEISERTESLRIANQELMQARERLALASRTDALTGIANRRQFDEQFALECKRATRAKSPLSVILVDIDWFKRINDRYGHERGDDCLCAVAAAIVSVVRATDCAARWGGEEFAVILPATDSASAVEFAGRIRHAVHDLALENLDAPLGRISVSCGVASGESDAHAALMQRADRALYEAKRLGRNRVQAG